MKDTSIIERLEALVARRELRNPGLTKVRIYRFGKRTINLWDHLIMPTKEEATSKWLHPENPMN